jgi:putative ABC transport system permease protein
MVVEIALAFVLVVGAGLMGRTFQQLVTTGAGFDPNRVLTLTTDVGSHRSRNLIGYYREALEKLHATPGIESAAMTSLLPMDYRVQRNLMISEHPQPNESEQPQAELFSVSTGYFQVMRIPLLRGRLFTGRDDAGAEPVALINNALARSKVPVENPIGKHVQVGHSP